MRYKRADKGKQRDLSKNSSALTEQSTLSITETHTHTHTRVNTQTKTKIHFNAFQVYRKATAPQQKVVPLKQHVH